MNTMNNKKYIKFISYIIAGILIMPIIKVPVFAEEDQAFEYFSYAEKLSRIGVFVGTGDGFELDRAPTRVEGLIILIRLLGQEFDALEGNYEQSPFTDVPDWATPYVNYGYAKGYTQGISADKFGSEEALQPNSFVTFVLRSLGYDDQQGDFTWDEAIGFSEDMGLLEIDLSEKLISEEFSRNHVAKISFNALLTEMNEEDEDVEEITLAKYLVLKGDIDKTIAINMEIVDESILSEINDGKSAGISTEELEDLSTYHVEDIVDINGETPLLGPPTASSDTVKQWAKGKGMSQEGIDLVDIYYEICGIKGLNPVIQYVQMCLETGYLYKVKSQAGIDASYHNPCGLKTKAGGEAYIASTFMSFDSWYEGIDAHTDHSALYAGVDGYPKADTEDPRHFPYLFGKVTTVEGLSGTWAESDYHTKLFVLYDEIMEMN